MTVRKPDGDRVGAADMRVRNVPAARPDRWWSFCLVASVLTAVYAGGNIPNPLYGLYQRAFGFPTVMVTVVFAVYVVGVLAALAFGGRLSDQLGRRPVLLASLVLSAIGSVLFAVADGLPLMFLGRVTQGLAIGLVSGTASAALVELHPTGDRRVSGVAVTASTNVGVGVGSVAAALCAQYAPAPLRLVFVLHAATLVVLAVTTRAVREPIRPTVTTWRELDLRPQPLAVPHRQLPVFLGTVASGFCGLAVVGLFSALTPSLLHDVLRMNGVLVNGFVILTMFGITALAQVASSRLGNQVSTLVGLLTVICGLGLLVAALHSGSLPVLATCIVALGCGLGLALRGSIALLNDATESQRRGAVNSSYFVVAYCGMALPVLGVGLGTRGVGLAAATDAFAGAIGVISLLAVGLLVWAGRRATSG
jgi:MFS family permease